MGAEDVRAGAVRAVQETAWGGEESDLGRGGWGDGD